MATKMGKYYVLTHEPGYIESTGILADGLRFRAALAIFCACQRNYGWWPSMHPSYGEICQEGRQGDLGETVYAQHFDHPVDITEMFRQ